MSDRNKCHWYLLTSKPREEQRAFDNLTNQGLDVFLPKVTKTKKNKALNPYHKPPYSLITYLSTLTKAKQITMLFVPLEV